LSALTSPSLVERRRSLAKAAAHSAVVVVLVCLGIMNIRARASWSEVEDGVLWQQSGNELAAGEVAPGSPGERAGVRAGDILLTIDGVPVTSAADVVDAHHAARAGTVLSYGLLRLDAQPAMLQIAVERVPSGAGGLYYGLAVVGIFSLLVGAWVRLRRPGDQATLHFFWLCVAFFGMLAFSYSGRLDGWDWVFYWGDIVARLVLPPMFVHFALVFPERPNSWVRSENGRRLLPLIYLPALLLGSAEVVAVLRGARLGALLTTMAPIVERSELLYLAGCLAGGLTIMVRALRRGCSVTSRRQLRWIVWGTALGAVPFIFGYALPFALGFTPSALFESTAVLLGLVPLAFASAIVRYRLMDVEVIIKRTLVYAAALAAIAAIYSILLGVAGRFFLQGEDQRNPIIALLATMVVVLLSRPVKNAIQNALDRAYYRDRYDYRRALVGFARDLNSDLDLLRLSERLVRRVTETLVIERMSLLLAPTEDVRDTAFVPVAQSGFVAAPPLLTRHSEIGTRLLAGHTLTLDDPMAQRRLDSAEVDVWRDAGIRYFVPCVSKDGTIAVMTLGEKASGEPLSSEDMALLTAVAAQAATALENGRLYRQLHVKADELSRLREYSENILESLTDGLTVLDDGDRVVRWNRRLEELYGLRHEEASGRQLREIFDDGFVEVLRSARGDAPDGAAIYRVPLTTRHADRRRLLVNVATTPLRSSDGSVAGTIVVVEDISARVQLEEQLQLSEKMASIGLLAAGVAHEVNTPLTGISSFVQILMEGAEADDPRTRILEKIEKQTFRAAKIVNGLLNLSRPAQADAGAVEVDVNTVINDVLSLLDHQLKTGRIQVRKEQAAPGPIVQGVEYKLQQVFLNLLLNARDAMPRGGWLTIATRLEGEQAIVEIADTGSGIPADHLSRIYDPFFTTKEIGKGTGLGLSITYAIVQEHGGAIGCQSAPGQGTRFTLTLPAVQARAAARSR
jgi:two-component system, NtrC family, sensor kinase